MFKTVLAVSLCGALLASGEPGFAQAPAPVRAAPSAAATAPQAQADPQAEYRAATMLVRNSILALDHAIQTGNFAVFRQLASPAFQQENSPEKLLGAFASLRANRVEMSAVAVIEPRFTNATIDQRGFLQLQGQFGPADRPFTFDTAYMPVNGLWKLLTITVSLQAPTQAPAR